MYYDYDDDDYDELIAERRRRRRMDRDLMAHPDPRDPDYPLHDDEEE